MVKRIISVFLTLVLFATILPLSVFAEKTDTNDEQETVAIEAVDSAALEASSESEDIESADSSVLESSSIEADSSTSNAPVSGESVDNSEPTSPAEETISAPEITVVSDADVPENDELFTGYLEQLFYAGEVSTCSEDYISNSPAFSCSYAGDNLVGQNTTVYNTLKPQIASVASGDSSSTYFTVPVTAILDGKLTSDDWGYDLPDFSNSDEVTAFYKKIFTFDAQLIINTLLEDCPYELYWYDKTKTTGGTKVLYPNISYGYTEEGNYIASFSQNSVVTFKFSVASDYAGSADYTTDSSAVTRANSAAENVQQIVRTAASETYTDYDKLVYYREQICNYVSYDQNYTSKNYGDVYQLINVFDGDPDTNVVCEGYAKAFQYLCERTTFSGNVYSVLAFGTLNGANHMWNIVHMENGNYLADITNCDSGTSGYPDKLFMKGATSGSVSEGYVRSVSSASFTYIYGQETLDTCASADLTLASSDYTPSTPLTGSVSLSLAAPSAGNALPVDLVCESDAYTVKSICWLDADGQEFTGTAACNGTYTLQVTLQATEGNTFGSGSVPVTLTYSDGQTVSASVTTYGTVLSFTDTLTLDHNIVYVPAKASTPSTAGNIEYYTCKGCGKYYSDAVGQNELTLDDILLDKPTLQTPVLVSVRLGADGVALTWNSCEYATSYRIYRKEDSGSWVSLASCDASAESTVTFIDTSSLNTGTGYTYTVRARCDDVMSDFDHTGLSVTYIAAPSLSSVTNVETGVMIKWTAVPNASRYAVYRKAEGEVKWTVLSSSVTSTSYTDTSVTSDSEYTYTVNAVVNGTYGCYSGTGIQIYVLAAPVIQKLANHYSTGIDITWQTVNGADVYYVYRKTDSSNWTLLGSTVYCNYYDSSAVSGTTYTYTLRARNTSHGITGYYNSGRSLLCLYSPGISSISCSLTGLTIRWTSVSGATSYTVYRKDSSGRWCSLAQSSSTSYLDKTVTSGENYTYTVVATANGVGSGYNRTGSTQLYLSTPSVSVRNRSDTSNGIEVSWTAVTGASEYRIYRKTSSEGWKILVSSIDGLTYLDDTVTNGTSYAYTVRAISSTPSALSYFVSSPSILRLTQPKLNSVSTSGTSLNISWQSSSGATSYILYRKVAGGSWSTLATVTSTRYTDSSVQSSLLYYYTVKAVNGSSESDYDHTGIAGVVLSTPALSSVLNRADGIELSWSAVANADRYNIYRKQGNSGWTRVAIVTEPYYLDDAVTDGTVYTYTVRAVSSISGSLSSYDTIGSSMMRLAQPTLQASASSRSIDLSWNSVDYAKQYILYRKESGASWKTFATVTSTSYSDTSAVAGTTYTYTVRAVNGNYMGEYDHIGVSCSR